MSQTPPSENTYCSMPNFNGMSQSCATPIKQNLVFGINNNFELIEYLKYDKFEIPKTLYGKIAKINGNDIELENGIKITVHLKGKKTLEQKLNKAKK